VCARGIGGWQERCVINNDYFLRGEMRNRQG
jgi:hypothetical protein